LHACVDYDMLNFTKIRYIINGFLYPRLRAAAVSIAGLSSVRYMNIRNCFFACIFVFAVCPHGKVEARYRPDVKWRIARTRHFVLYYPAGHEEFASRVFSLSNGVYRDVTGYFGVSPRVLPVVLHPHTDMFNGFYSPFPNRISLFETPHDDLRRLGSTTSDILDLVFVHEYTHYVHITSTGGWFGRLSRLLGRGTAVTNMVSPGWIIEGITTNLETKFTGGGRGRSGYFRGMMRSLYGPGELWSLSAAGTLSPYAPPRGRIYLSGYYMVEYLNRVYGGDAFARLSSCQAAHPLAGARRALKHVTGRSPRRFYREFLEDFSSRCDSIRAAIAVPGLPSGRTVAGDGLDGFESHFWTERGTIMALRKGYDGPTALLEIDPGTGGVLKEIRTGRLFNRTPVRGFPGGKVVFGEVFHHLLGEGEINVSDLVVFDPGKKTHQRLTRDAHIFSADISPDGTTFAAVRRNGMWTELVLLDRDGGNIRPFVSKPGMYFRAPVWSPDGRTVAVTVKIGRRTDIALVDAGSGGMRPLFAPDDYGDDDPSFSPDGEWLVFSSERGTTWNIYAWNLRERKLFRLTSVFTAATEPLVSPDGGTLSFLVLSGGKNEIRVMPFEPGRGEPVDVVTAGKLEAPDIGVSPPPAIPGPAGMSPWETYRPFIHAPWAGKDRKGLAPGVFLVGGDPVRVNTYFASLRYDRGTGRPGYDILLENRSFWPTLRVNVYDRDTGGKSFGAEERHWYRERGGEIGLGMSVIHRTAPELVTGYYEAGVRTRRFGRPETGFIDESRDRSFSLYLGFLLMRIPDAAARDMVPGWGRGLYVRREEELAVLGGEIRGHDTVAVFKQFAPSPFRHHGFEWTVAHQNQRGLIRFDSEATLPRGYTADDEAGGLNLRNTLTLSLEYRFPILFFDRGVGMNFVHGHLLRGSFFVDYGAGWSGDFALNDWTRETRTSLGATLSVQTSVFSFVPVEVGLYGGYKVREGKGFARLMVDFWGRYGMGMDKSWKRFLREASL